MRALEGPPVDDPFFGRDPARPGYEEPRDGHTGQHGQHERSCERSRHGNASRSRNRLSRGGWDIRWRIPYPSAIQPIASAKTTSPPGDRNGASSVGASSCSVTKNTNGSRASSTTDASTPDRS